MSLATYKKKRSFNKTPEPEGKKKTSGGILHFVVQKHDASRLHYDFRLEMEGVLKSWAIPKGPSMNPEDKRLAMMVEDHPYDYKDFEGIIPPGNYGAGTVIVWDEGTYEPDEEYHEKGPNPEKELLNQLKKGSLKITLHGKKLKGSFALVKIKSSEDNAWLLIKHRDKYATDADITKKEKSVQSGLKLEQVARESTNEWISNRKTTTPKTKSSVTASKAASPNIASKKKKAVKKKVPSKIEALIKNGQPAPMPSDIIPMLSTLTDEAFDDKDWLFEIKWDGYRALAYLDNGKVNIMSRKNLSFNHKFSPVVEALQELELKALLDGEIVALNEESKGDFQLLQQWQKTGRGQLVYYVFDILWINGYNVMQLPLLQRKEILQQILPEHDMIRFSDHVSETGRQFFELAADKGLEGIMAKHANSTYTPHVRTKQWLKIKTHQRQEVVIAGFTETRGSRTHFGALVLGIYENDELVYIGHSGSGFTEKSLAEVYKKLKPLITTQCPFAQKPKTNMPVTWVKPKLVCEVKFSEWTKDNILRQPIFMGMREDKDPKEVYREKAISAEPNVIEKEAASPKKQTAAAKQMKTKNAKTKTASTARKAKTKPVSKAAARKATASAEDFLNETEKEQIVIISKKELTFTNLDKIYWPAEKITKRDMLNYYYRIAPFIMPYMKDRPQSMNRFPDGIKKPGFYQKNVTGKVADWIARHDYELEGEKKQYLVCSDEATLLYMANLGCIEMNPWHSTVRKPDNPSWCVIDLDPGNISFDKVIEAAQVIKQLADELEIDTYCKTSGSTGLHIYIPLGAAYDYDQSRQLAELLVTIVHQEISSFTSLERSPAKRKNKIYLDYLQNRSIQTIAAPYSLRPKPGATASAPLHWEEVKKGLSIQDFTIENMYDRAKDVGDIFKPVIGKGINLKKVLAAIAKRS
jgi:bifunctional non-homologous end joining protein LigD